MTKPGRDDGIDDEERRLEGRPHMKKKKHGGGNRDRENHEKGGKSIKHGTYRKKPEDPEVNGDGWWASV